MTILHCYILFRFLYDLLFHGDLPLDTFVSHGACASPLVKWQKWKMPIDFSWIDFIYHYERKMNTKTLHAPDFVFRSVLLVLYYIKVYLHYFKKNELVKNK